MMSSCRKANDFSDIPVISLKSLFLQKYTSGQDSIFLIIAFEDGDGDIGLNAEDTLGKFKLGEPAYFNLVITYFEKVNGQYIETKPSGETFSLRTPYLAPAGHNKALKGEISYRLPINTSAKPNDTTRYEVFLYDRALHKSNVITTNDIILNQQ
jgi:hypothetical protein